MNTRSTELTKLAHMAVRQARLLKGDGFLVEARELVTRALALMWLADEMPKAVPVRINRRALRPRH